jgi:hypothetical protein
VRSATASRVASLANGPKSSGHVPAGRFVIVGCCCHIPYQSGTDMTKICMAAFFATSCVSSERKPASNATADVISSTVSCELRQRSALPAPISASCVAAATPAA